MVARLGQQRELVTNALSKVVPLSMSSDLRLGMCRSARGFKSFTVRSSVRMRITLGRFGSCFWFSACFPSAEGKQAERAQAKVTPRSAYKATKSILLVYPLPSRPHCRTVHRGAPFGYPLALPRGGSSQASSSHSTFRVCVYSRLSVIHSRDGRVQFQKTGEA